MVRSAVVAAVAASDEEDAVILEAHSRLVAAVGNSALRGDPLQDVLRAQAAVIDVSRVLAARMRGLMDGQRPKFSERDRLEMLEIARMIAETGGPKRDRSRSRFMVLVFAVLVVVSAAGAGLAGYAVRSDRCVLLDAWAASLSARR